MKIVAISDTHGMHRRINMPEGDVLLHCGDFCRTGTMAEVTDFASWLIEQPFVLWIEITQAGRLLALADRKLALLEAVSNTTKIGYREAFRHRRDHRRTRAQTQYFRNLAPL